jgi:hypothetical protein
MIMTGLGVALVAGMALLSPVSARASGSYVTGELRVGQKLTVVTDCADGGSSFVWHLDSPWGEGLADGTEYTVSAKTVGHALVVAFQCGGSGMSVSSAGVVVLAEFETVGSPGVTGDPRVGQQLTATPGSWSPTPDGFAYQWLQNGTEIKDATSSTYLPQADDLGKTLSVRVTASLAGYSDASADSSSTAQVQSGIFETLTAPAISGTARVGETLTTSAGEWSPKPASISYQWWRGGAPISQETSSSYRLTKADHGKWVSVQVTVNQPGYMQAVYSTGPDALVAGPVDARGVTVKTVKAGTPTAGAGDCVSIPVSIAYEVSSESASVITALTATAKVRNSSGANIGTVTLSSTSTALTGVASGTYQRCSSDARGVLVVSGLSGSYSGLFSAAIVDASRRPSSEVVQGTFESSLTASVTVSTPTPSVTAKPAKRAAGKIIYVQAFRNHHTRTVIGKVVVYNAAVKRWVAVSGGPKIILQKRVDGVWKKVRTTKASKAAWFTASWKASKKATYRLVRADRTNVVSKTFSR